MKGIERAAGGPYTGCQIRRRTPTSHALAPTEAHPVAFGLLLVVVGLLLLVDSLNLIEGVGFEELWPVLLVVLGAAIVYDRVRRAWRRR